MRLIQLHFFLINYNKSHRIHSNIILFDFHYKLYYNVNNIQTRHIVLIYLNIYEKPPNLYGNVYNN